MIGRVTQRMMVDNSLASLQSGLGRLEKLHEQLSTGRVLNRPSDSPTDTTTAMRLRSSLSDRTQYARNAEDGQAWLNLADQTLRDVNDRLRRARDLGLQGASSGGNDQASRAALAAEVDQIRKGILAAANTTYLDRPIFGGVTTGSEAFHLDPTTDAVGFAGQTGEVKRAVGDGVKIAVNVDGEQVFGSVFADLANLSAALQSGDVATINDGLQALKDAQDRIGASLSDIGAREDRVDTALQNAKDGELSVKNSLSNVENVDIVEATVQLQLQEVAYQTSLAATAKVIQPSLWDFLR